MQENCPDRYVPLPFFITLLFFFLASRFFQLFPFRTFFFLLNLFSLCPRFAVKSRKTSSSNLKWLRKTAKVKEKNGHLYLNSTFPRSFDSTRLGSARLSDFPFSQTLEIGQPRNRPTLTPCRKNEKGERKGGGGTLEEHDEKNTVQVMFAFVYIFFLFKVSFLFTSYKFALLVRDWPLACI